MAVNQSHLTDIYESDPGLMQNYCKGWTGTEDQHCFSETFSEVENAGAAGNMSHILEEDMSTASSTDDSAAAAAVFRHLDILIRQKIDGEIEQLKSNVNRILAEQQQEFVEAFGLQDDFFSSEASTPHVVPQSNYCDVDGSSDDCQLQLEDSSDCDSSMISQFEYEKPLCSKCRGVLSLSTITSRQEDKDKEDEEKIVMDYLLRLMIASSAMAVTLKRKEYRT